MVDRRIVATSEVGDFWRAWLLLAALQFSGALVGCSSDDPCKTAKARLEQCIPQIRKAIGDTAIPCRPFSVSGECGEFDRCIANCVVNASCDEIAVAMFCPITDPNSPPVSNGHVSECVDACR
jgi:hypothetical protein